MTVSQLAVWRNTRRVVTIILWRYAINTQHFITYIPMYILVIYPSSPLQLLNNYVSLMLPFANLDTFLSNLRQYLPLKNEIPRSSVHRNSFYPAVTRHPDFHKALGILCEGLLRSCARSSDPLTLLVADG